MEDILFEHIPDIDCVRYIIQLRKEADEYEINKNKYDKVVNILENIITTGLQNEYLKKPPYKILKHGYGWSFNFEKYKIFSKQEFIKIFNIERFKSDLIFLFIKTEEVNKKKFNKMLKNIIYKTPR